MSIANKFICFDTESAQGRYNGQYIEELIEISMMDATHTEMFYHRFKPSRLSHWDTKIHHIHPKMVAKEPHFKEYRSHVQRLFDNASHIIGFSLIDDFKAMSKVGITGLEEKEQIELRHLYWYCIGRHNNVPFYSGPGLSVCARELGVAIDEEGVHTANGDTRVTLDLFFALIKLFAEQEKMAVVPSEDSPEFIDFIKLIKRRIGEAKYQYDRSIASGYIHVVPHAEGGCRFISSLDASRPEGDSVLTIAVNARRRAEYELEKIFNKRRIANTKNFNLTDDDLKSIGEYNNEFDGQESMYHKLLGLQRASVIVLKKNKR